jgi:hypothetical protein
MERSLPDSENHRTAKGCTQWPNVSLITLVLHCLLGIIGPCTLPLLLPHLYYFAYKTVHVLSRGAHQLQPSDFYNPTLALAPTLSQ